MPPKNDSTLTIRLPKSDKEKLIYLSEGNCLSLSSYISSKVFNDYVKD